MSINNCPFQLGQGAFCTFAHYKQHPCSLLNKIQVVLFHGRQHGKKLSLGKAGCLMSQLLSVTGTDELCTRLWFSELMCLGVQFIIYIQGRFSFQVLSSLRYKPGCQTIDIENCSFQMKWTHYYAHSSVYFCPIGRPVSDTDYNLKIDP